jgi:hypothetical protein
MPLALYPSDLQKAVCVSQFRGGWSGQSSDWIPLQDDLDFECGQGSLARLQERLAKLSVTIDSPSSGFGDIRKSSDDVFGLQASYAGPAYIPDDGCELQGSGFISYDWLKSSNNDRIPKNPTAILLLPNISFVSKAG